MKKFYRYTASPDDMREFRIEFADERSIQDAKQIADDYRRYNVTSILHIWRGFEVRCAGEVVSDDSMVLHIVCHENDINELEKRWSEEV